ncbi:hypothetical protein [Deinococcus sp. Leaf326]|uniref:hypothetical protein n=1 Tax=Deinococcus sp. Leaf326 TaxID=1736338 RepID=UPI0006FC3991|nr:hypothetical protein [Deinococcus sp. Leaf326]KQQ99424.1 hypothetical protein ASF71_13720 [Deinococcus sp. Leaf326]
MTDNSNRYGNEPLGKSVEEVEQESSNVVNSPVEGEARRAGEETFVPVIANANATGVPGAIFSSSAMVDRTGTADDGTARTRDTDESSEA